MSPKLADYRLLSFDVYGTLIDWESGVLNALNPLLEGEDVDIPRENLLTTFHEAEKAQQASTPDMKYADLLTTIHPDIAHRLGLHPPTEEDNVRFGQSVGTWPAFPDTVDALRRLGEYYRLVTLSNVDRESFSATNAGPLQDFPFDMVITAEDVGSYKPDLKNFEHMLAAVEDQFGVRKDQVIQTAQSQFHDHAPARKMGR
ncbi:MAG: hypothetical protein L6R39_002650 [Caloplaca ligustica]|nr:MAG: hypothetical protein L6R39_002650 [Caloplaca ligustica]